MKVTGHTITVAQILELRAAFLKFDDPAFDFECPGGRPSGWVATCDAALEPWWDVTHAGGIMMNASISANREELAALWNGIHPDATSQPDEHQ